MSEPAVIVSPSGKIYARTGGGGQAPSTIQNKLNANTHFQAFLSSKEMLHVSELTEEAICQVELFQEFATYLCDYAVSGGIHGGP